MFIFVFLWLSVLVLRTSGDVWSQVLLFGGLPRELFGLGLLEGKNPMGGVANLADGRWKRINSRVI